MGTMARASALFAVYEPERIGMLVRSFTDQQPPKYAARKSKTSWTE